MFDIDGKFKPTQPHQMCRNSPHFSHKAATFNQMYEITKQSHQTQEKQKHHTFTTFGDIILRNIPWTYWCVITVRSRVAMEFTEIHTLPLKSSRVRSTLEALFADKSRNMNNLLFLLDSRWLVFHSSRDSLVSVCWLNGICEVFCNNSAMET